MQKFDPKAVVGGGRLVFRGDDRPPAEMFKAGFFARNMDSQITYKDSSVAPLFIHEGHEATYQRHGVGTTVGKVLKPEHAAPTLKGRYDVALETSKMPIGQTIAKVARTPDIVNSSAVCVTPRFAIAILFPPKSSPTDATCPEYTWVYALYVRKLFNTHAQQVADGLRTVEQEMRVRQEIAKTSAVNPLGGAELLDAFASSVAFWPLFGQELASKTVPAQDVVAAIRVRRTWSGPDWTHGATYSLDRRSLRFNYRCRRSVPKDVIKAVRAFLKKEPAQGTTPSRSSGFHKDTENTRTSIALTQLAAVIEEKAGRMPAAPTSDDVLDEEWME